ncbi:MAG: hypothetical protein WD872_16880 [Pirellulaceae bacterium]
MPTVSRIGLHAWPLLIVTAIALAGCSRVPAGVVPVAGRVTLAGKPLAGAIVTFQPLQPGESEGHRASGSVGRTDADGRFTLRLVHPDALGAVVGRHAVSITTATTAGGDAARPTGERVPQAWRSGSRSFEVPDQGTDSADFELQPD